MLALCTDVGTSLIKTVAYDGAGAEITVARRPMDVLRPRPGHAEQDMRAVWDGVASSLREASERVRGDVDFVALTAQGDGCWLVDERGEPTGNAALWSDGRNAEIVDRWERDGTIERAFRINGSLTFPGLPNAILHHMREHEPGRVERAHRALYCGGWTFFKLTGELAVDESDASVPLLDIRSHRYSPELLRLYDLEWAAPLLPEVRGMERRVARLTPEAASDTGLPAGLPVVLAPYDIASTAIGIGAAAPGRACSILGTTLCTEVMTDRVNTEGEPAGFTIAMGVPDRYLRAYPTLAGTDVIDWAVAMLRLEEPAELVALARGSEPGARGAVFMPYLSPAGERAPFLNPSARGTFVGLSLEHGRDDIAMAVLEGLSLVVRDCLEASAGEPTELGLCGGGASSDFWCQLIADVTGIATFRSLDSELGAKGAFITGLIATGRESDTERTAERLACAGDRFEPREDQSALYAERYRQFVELRGAAAVMWQRIADASRAGGVVAPVHG